jgi:hypothetical protein
VPGTPEDLGAFVGELRDLSARLNVITVLPGSTAVTRQAARGPAHSRIFLLELDSQGLGNGRLIATVYHSARDKVLDQRVATAYSTWEYHSGRG